MEKILYKKLLCVCVRACVRARARARVVVITDHKVADR